MAFSIATCFLLRSALSKATSLSDTLFSRLDMGMGNASLFGSRREPVMSWKLARESDSAARSTPGPEEEEEEEET